MELKKITDVIPHRYPFLLIDKILECESGVRVTAQKNVTHNEYFFQGHFPQEPVMPGVLVVEAMAQAGAYAILSLEENAGKIAYFGALDKVKFRGKVVPGDVLTLEAEIIKLKKTAGNGKGRALVNGKLVTECEFTFILN